MLTSLQGESNQRSLLWPDISLVSLFSHCSVADQQDPRQRMVAMLRFYLSSFHAARTVSCISPAL